MVMILIGFAFGHNNYSCLEGNHEYTKDIDHSVVFLKILLNNIGFSILIIVGAISLNVITAGVLFYNGYIWGLQFRTIMCDFGIDYFLRAVIPHFFIELLWILFIVHSISVFSKALYRFYSNKIDSENFIKVILSQKKRLLISFSLIILSAIFEIYLPIILI